MKAALLLMFSNSHHFRMMRMSFSNSQILDNKTANSKPTTIFAELLLLAGTGTNLIKRQNCIFFLSFPSSHYPLLILILRHIQRGTQRQRAVSRR